MTTKFQQANAYDLLCLMFVYLKLSHQVDWSWWWIMLPWYGQIAIMFFAEIFAHVYAESQGKISIVDLLRKEKG